MDKILKKIIRLTMLKELIQSFVIVLILLFFMSSDGIAQINAASPANWLYPDGNPEATRKIIKGSEAQTIDLFQVKWSSSSISGDIKPLIGNIIDNNRLIPEFMYAPNEIAGVIGGKLVVIDAKGKTHKRANLPPFSKNISMLIDTLASKISSNVTGLVALGIETVEYENLDDSLAYAYICSYEQSSDTVSILKRLAIDLRGFEPNIFASIKPIFCRRYASQFQIYGTVNMSKPIVSSPTPDTPPFFRGITQFNTRELKSFYPMSVIGDDTLARKMVGPEVSFSQPSIGVINSNMQRILLPIYPSNDLDVMIENPNSTNQTFADRPYLISMDMDGTVLKEAEIHLDLSSIISISDTRPQIRPYFVNIRDANNSDSVFILVAEEYRGVEGSIGTAKIHLFDNLGGKLSAPIEQIQGADISPSYEGDKNHLWSVAVGNLDGNNSNALIPNYPNNRGNEIILTQSTREFVVAASKLIVMRYFSGNKVPKKSPPDTYLNEFDTICTFRINGWLAAVNDIDGADY